VLTEEVVIKVKKNIWGSFVIMCLLLACYLINCKISVNASPRTWTVDDNGPADFRKIQDAINNDSVSSGDIIFVRNGYYYENVVINKSLSLIGESVDLTVIEGLKNNVISIVADNVSVTSFTIQKSGSNLYDSAINISRSNNVVIGYNKIIKSINGISLYSSNNNTIIGNMISSNSFSGVSFYSSNDNLVYGNNISNNYYSGIFFFSSSQNVISGNNVSLTSYGIYFQYSSGNLASSNTISLNDYGIYLTISSNNTIYHNNFNNTNQASLTDSANIWSYINEGNYWTDYIGQDANGDGIGDNPYIIDANNKDNNPLMGIFSTFNITYQSKTYRFDFISNSTIPELILQIGAETGNKIMLFNATGKDGTVGFCRIWIPTDLMKYPYIVLCNTEELNRTLLGVSNETYACLYFTYFHRNSTIRIISSQALYLYNELFNNYIKLQMDFYNLNVTYYQLLNSYGVLSENYTQLQQNLGALNESCLLLYNLNVTYYELLDRYVKLQMDFYNLNVTYYQLLNSYNAQLQQHLSNYSEQMQNVRSLMYIVAAITAIYIITTVYLSKRAHTGTVKKTKVFEEEK